ncbi:MAG: hypothetical protein KDD92_19555 [Caldilineaceae bacterium]|nr:hypothetical protein [Caldilineaceae bacterium]
MPATKAMLLPIRATCIGTLLMMAAMPAAAQSLKDIFRPLVVLGVRSFLVPWEKVESSGGNP